MFKFIPPNTYRFFSKCNRYRLNIKPFLLVAPKQKIYDGGFEFKFEKLHIRGGPGPLERRSQWKEVQDFEGRLAFYYYTYQFVDEDDDRPDQGKKTNYFYKKK